MVDIPKNEEGIQSEVTPQNPDAITEQATQPQNASAPESKPTVEELSAQLAEVERKSIRYKEQLQGREKEVEELKSLSIARSFFGDVSTEKPKVTEDPETEPVKKTIVNERTEADVYRDTLIVQSAIRSIREDLAAKYGSDEDVPFIAEEIQSEIGRLDPSGKSLLSPQAWETTYQAVRGRRLSEIREKYASKAEQVTATETIKLTDAPSVPTNDSPSGDGLSFMEAFNTMSTDELKAKYPKEYSAMMRDGLWS